MGIFVELGDIKSFSILIIMTAICNAQYYCNISCVPVTVLQVQQL